MFLLLLLTTLQFLHLNSDENRSIKLEHCFYIIYNTYLKSISVVRLQENKKYESYSGCARDEPSLPCSIPAQLPAQPKDRIHLHFLLSFLVYFYCMTSWCATPFAAIRGSGFNVQNVIIPGRRIGCAIKKGIKIKLN